MLEAGVSAKTIRPDCAPVVNLFNHTAEPILIDQLRYEYPVVPDVRRRHAYEIFSIEKVVSTSPQSQEVTEFEPFYSYRHATLRGQEADLLAPPPARPPRGAATKAPTLFVPVDLSGAPPTPTSRPLTVRLPVYSRDCLPACPSEASWETFELEGHAGSSASSPFEMKPPPTLRAPVGRGAPWRLISQLSLTISPGERGQARFTGNPAGSTISPIRRYLESRSRASRSLDSRKHFARVISGTASRSAGHRSRHPVRREQFGGGGVYLFDSVLEHFLGLYVSMNSFSQLIARTAQRKE